MPRGSAARNSRVNYLHSQRSRVARFGPLTKHSMAKLLLVTDAWHPQVNGVVTALDKTKDLVSHPRSSAWAMPRCQPHHRNIDVGWLFKLRVAIARCGEMDLARWWNSNKQLASAGSFRSTPHFAQSRSKQIVEPVFGQIKQARGFRQFLLRGVEKVRAEWAMICTAHNSSSSPKRPEAHCQNARSGHLPGRAPSWCPCVHCCVSGNRPRRPSCLMAATSRAHSLKGRAGVPPMRAPGSTSFLTCAMPAICAPLPTFTWSITPECAPMTTKSPSSAEPAMPLWATITQCRPMTTLWAICTRLSIFVPSPMMYQTVPLGRPWSWPRFRRHRR